MTRLLRLLAAAVLAVVAIAACSSDDDSPSAAAGASAPAAPSASSAPASGTSAAGGGEGSSSAGGGGTITIRDFKFGAPLTVAPGATVEVENEDTAAHDVVADDGSFKTPSLGKDEQGTFTAPTRPGTYKFSCSLHPGSMSGIGTLIVQG